MSAVPIQPLPALMTERQLADFLGVRPETLRRYVFAHELRAIRVGLERRFLAQDVADFLSLRPATARNWRGVIGWLLLLVAGAAAFLNFESLKAFFATMQHAGSRDPVEQFKGLATFGIVLVSILAAMRIAIERSNRNGSG